MDSPTVRQCWRYKRFLTAGLIGLLLSGSASAQWIKIQIPGTPRKPDGTPDLTAPAPKSANGTPDFSGIWKRAFGRGGINAGGISIAQTVDSLMTPAAAAIYKARVADGGKAMPSGRCLPHGMLKALSVPVEFKIVQTPSVVLVLHEEFNNYRQIFMDPHDAAAVKARSWFGHSVGKWDADGTLVVDTTNFLDDAWLDVAGHPATTALHITERFRRPDFGHLAIEFTIEDPGAYTKDWTWSMTFNLVPDTELIEDICENDKDAVLLFGK